MADRSDRSPRRWTLIASAMLAGLILVGAVFIVVSDGSGDGQAGDTASPRPSASGSASQSVTQPQSCGATDKEQDLPSTTPDDVSWNIWHGAALPKSKSAGPVKADKKTGVTSCYARTPMGAAMASINIGIRLGLAAPDTAIVDEQVADGPYKEKLRQVVKGYAAPDSKAQIAGFRVITYDRSNATISLAAGDSADGYAESRGTVAWQDGTWRLVATADDLEPETSWRQIESLDGYVELKGVS